MDLLSLVSLTTTALMLLPKKKPETANHVATPNVKVPAEQYVYANGSTGLFKKPGENLIMKMSDGKYLGKSTGNTSGDWLQVRTNLDNLDYFFYVNPANVKISGPPTYSNKSYAEKMTIKNAYA